MINQRKKQVNQWYIYPNSLQGGRFLGYYTKDDPTQIKGVFPIGQNIKFTENQTPTVRDGIEKIDLAEISPLPVKKAWVFERRDGKQIEMKVIDDGVYFRVDTVMSDFNLLKDGYSSSDEWTYAIISEAGDVNSRLSYCNGLDDWEKWTGVYGLLDSFDNVAHTLTLKGSVNLSDLGFTATGSFNFNGVAVSYTGLSTTSFTGCGDMAAFLAVEDDIIVQQPIAMTGSSVVKSSLAIAHDGRIHARSEAKRSVGHYSKIDNPDDWTTGSTDGDGGAKELEQGGPITAYAHDEKQLYMFKSRMIKTLEYIGTGSRIDVPKYGTLKPTDDKSITVGALGSKSTFHAPNGIIFTTPDKQLVFLKREQSIDYPQILDISDQIKPTFQRGVHDEAAGIVFNSYVFYAYKQDTRSSFNDTVLVYDLIRNIWHTPIIGWNVSDWTIVNGELHFHSSINSDTYKVIIDKTDEGEAFTTALRTWSEDFGAPQFQKYASYVLVEIYQQENSEIKLDVLYDEDGFTGQESFNLAGTDTNNKFNSIAYNPFGLNPFGTERFGSNADVFGMKKYRYLLELKKNIEFYNISIQLSTEKAGINYELLRFGYLLDSILELPNYKLLKGTN